MANDIPISYINAPPDLNNLPGRRKRGNIKNKQKE
jgi:hypothetical protein